MCYGCYEEYGKPTLVTPEIEEAAKLVQKVYEFSCVGGNLHIVTDDWNIGDNHLRMCEAYIEKNGDPNSEATQAEKACLNAFWKLSVSHRAAALAIHEGFLKP